MRQRTINFSALMRDMRNHRSPEKRLQDELVEALQRTTSTLETLYGLKGIDAGQSTAITGARTVLAKVEARNA
ncbi:hypothetical protein [Microvirga sp. BSC39]|uniref:hypothetical protein n=1 Tax=Microvirga sp. BSC39 TaxID=1549810 RepID=UPI0004E91E7D|nr:hypothetical protein [Microvirga sp. BSC39]KFG68675.1 hypothetical protein JH26_14455 [Microvirga sp. BSC39]